eukprot:m.172494 g.172494  ORF g.172494 m.172494 type:complete len:861 (+) comp39084_c0_seq55:7110-9692(+)
MHRRRRFSFRLTRKPDDQDLRYDEAAVACGWLRAAGFPQYAQLYEVGRFPTDLTEIDIEQDHKFLNDYEMEALMRRLKVLQRYAGMRIDDGKDEESEEEDEGRALSYKWKYRRRSGKWQRRRKSAQPGAGSSTSGTGTVGRHQSLRSQLMDRSIQRKMSTESPTGEVAMTELAAVAVATPTSPPQLKIVVEGICLSPPGSSSASGESVSELSYMLEKSGDESTLPRRCRLGTPSSVANLSSTTDDGEVTNDSDADSGACSDGEIAEDPEFRENFSADRVLARRGSGHPQWTQVIGADPSSNDPEHVYSPEDAKSVVARRKRFRWHSFQRQHRDVILPKSVTHIPMSELSVGKLTLLRKLALLKLTSMIERYANISADGHYSIGSVQRYLRKHLSKQPDYADKQVFGVPLHVILQRTGQPLPQTILYAMRYLRRTSLDTVGMFRRTGSKAKMQKLKEINEENPDNVRYTDSSPYEVADMLKEYFRDLPERLLTNKLSESLILIVAFVPRELRLQAIQAVMLLLPDENREALQSLLLFLSDVAAKSEQNKMTAENLAICFAPSLLSLPGQASRHSWEGKKGSRKPGKGVTRSPKEAASDSTNHANECLTLMIQECQKLLMIPRDYLIHCRFTHLEEGDPVPYQELGVDPVSGQGNHTTFIDSCVQGILKESADKFRGWRGGVTRDGVEVTYKKVGDGHPLRLWRGTAEVPAQPGEVLHRLLRERHLWDMDITRWRVVETLDESTEIFQYSLHSMAPHPTRDFTVLRSWRSHVNGARALVETSVSHPAVSKSPGSLQATILAARFLIEPTGAGSSRLTYITRIDTRGRSADYYNSGLGPYVAALVGRVRDSFKASENGMETEV